MGWEVFASRKEAINAGYNASEFGTWRIAPDSTETVEGYIGFIRDAEGQIIVPDESES